MDFNAPLLDIQIASVAAQRINNRNHTAYHKRLTDLLVDEHTKTNEV